MTETPISTFDAITGQLSINAGTIAIPEAQFEKNTDIRSISLPDSLERINELAFAYNTNLETIEFGNSLNLIGKESFFAPFSLKTLTIPDSVTILDDYAFQYARALETINIGNSVISIGKRSFSNARVLKQLHLGTSVQAIGERAFYSSPELESLVFPASVSSIGAHAFGQCLKLESITIPDSTVFIGEAAFSGTAIKAVELPAHFESNPPINAFDPGVVFTYGQGQSHPQGELTPDGWSAEWGTGKWSKSADKLRQPDQEMASSFVLKQDTVVQTQAGDDMLLLRNKIDTALDIQGVLKMNGGRDLIEVESETNLIAINNEGDILLGKGNDQVRITGGRIDGSGVIKFGKGRDEMIGFGNQNLVHGGKGQDVLRLEPGTYALKRNGKRYQLSNDDASMTVKGFERLGALGSDANEMIALKSQDEPVTVLVTSTDLTLQ